MSNASPLFRAEVLQAKQVQWLGNIRIGRPASFAWVTGTALLLAAALIAFAWLGEVTGKAKLPGLLVPSGGLLQIAAPQAGQVAEVLVQEGEVVRPGQALMRLHSERITGSGEASALNAQAIAQRRAGLDTERLLTQQQARQRQDALNDRLRSLQAEERQAQGELDTSRLRAQLAVKSQERFAELARSGFVSASQVQQKQEELLDLQLRERNAERSLQALLRDTQALRAELTSTLTSAQTTLAQIDRSLAALSQESIENEARLGLTITAPQAATVSALTLHPGQAVQTGQTLISLVSQQREAAAESAPGSLEAQLFAPSRTTGFVRPGQTVWLRYAAYPYQKFGMAEGKVTAVSQTPIAAQDLPLGQAQALLSAAQSNEPLYRITVQLGRQAVTVYGKSQPLKAG
ncbi:HlyD family secretion protein [Roseateles oligotrophus]|uniref:HlyD family secretion protein n=1 Tax=Roseateles oligotrophus TaxID=1769250 RepID=A0ABT2YCY3_9BURK|nr:HlyD family secretion protein [Roseateles oligotrophus]MCV2367886.1 HlyD family secretion protein [Roseateles oligotrophus]